MGLLLDETPLGICIRDAAIAQPLEQIRSHSPEGRASLSANDLRLFPGYSPSLTPAFAHWLEDSRDALAQALVRIFMADIAHLRASHSWLALSRTCSHIRVLDPLNEEVATVGAEALAMLGCREEALDVIDSFTRHSGMKVVPDALRRLRVRLAKSPHINRTGSLRGRRDCLSQLSTEWTSVSPGGARVVTVLGPPGIGKSRILREFASCVGLAGGKSLHYKCDSSSRHYPLSLFAHLLPELRAMRGSLGIAPHHRAVLGRLLPSTTPSLAVERGAALELLRSDLELAIVDLLEAVSAETPMLITVDDAHLLDDTSCALLKDLACSPNAAAILVVTCCRPRDRVSALFVPSSRSSSHHLSPLDEEDSRELLLELSPLGAMSPERLQWCLQQSGGNPFYLHSLSRFSPEASALPFDITSLATASYFGLEAIARLVLESCLYLGSLATLNRLAAVTRLDDISLATALRELESMDLVSLQGTLVRGPHSLLDDAIRTLIPSTVSALVHKRIAETLTDECNFRSYSIPLALAAARSWLASGDNDAAVALLRRGAADIAAIGDPGTAASLLTQIAYGDVPDASRRLLLDDIIAYADAAGSGLIAVQATKERLHLATHAGDAPHIVRRLEFRLIEEELFNGSALDSAVRQLSTMLAQCSDDEELRMQCIATLLIIADAEYDTTLAETLAGQMEDIALCTESKGANRLRALLIYHTTFGDRTKALDIATELMQRFPSPDMSEQCRTARRFASYAFYRLMRHADAKTLLLEDYAFMSSKGVRSEALYAASLLTEIEIAAGQFESARTWFREVDMQLNGGSAHKLSPNSGYYSSAALFAMMDGRHSEAERLLAIPLAEDPRMHTPRYEAILTALRLRSYVMKDTMASERALVSRLWQLYSKGRSLGGQDTIVEMLWCAEIIDGRSLEASELLRTYLTEHRREGLPIEWSLRATTAADEAWCPITSSSH
jgi:hypothetical protein